jgi:hypothetical protein
LSYFLKKTSRLNFDKKMLGYIWGDLMTESDGHTERTYVSYPNLTYIKNETKKYVGKYVCSE